MNTEELLLYRDARMLGIMKNMVALMEGPEEASSHLACRTAGDLLELAVSHGFYGNLWHCYLAYVLANHENTFSKTCEIRGRVEGSINLFARHDLELFLELFHYDIASLDSRYRTNLFAGLADYKDSGQNSRIFNKRIRQSICRLGEELALARDVEQSLSTVTEFYRECGVGKLGLHKAFRIGREDETGIVQPITNIEHIYLKDLVGYEMQKKKLIANTEAFVEGRKANNCLLFGDSGTGKSSSIKALLNEYYDRGLRMIEVYKHQFHQLPAVISEIKDRNYRFIILMDDLSFEDFEIEYKYLKAVIEGGLEKKPDNVLIYATSNRRHLIREKFSDKRELSDDLHENDTVQEKLSLVSRFGVQIYYGAPEKKEFQEIVRVLADRYGIDMPEEELLLEANRWELSHGGLSGRTATQFIHHLAGRSSAAR